MRHRSIALAALFVAGSVQAAGFDCLKASSADEKTVCVHRSLNDGDVKMATLYQLDLRLVPMGSRDALRDEQVAWLTRRRACAANIRCLARLYDRRIARLQAVIDTRVYPHGPF
jgi:uncharacterized protein